MLPLFTGLHMCYHGDGMSHQTFSLADLLTFPAKIVATLSTDSWQKTRFHLFQGVKIVPKLENRQTITKV